jgi:hypothetical protein
MPRLHRLFPLALASTLAFALPTTLLPTISVAQDVGVSITVAPPPIPVYAQPVIPGAGYLWSPGYWAWGPVGYYWVPGTWILPPRVGLLWTPGYWAWVDGGYFWHAGYWGPHIGFYGGINYGFGYFGVGFVGGHWDHDRFFYNRSVNNFGGVHITNVYNEPVRNVSVTRVSFNGGRDGVNARPSAAEDAASHEQHVGPTGLQSQHEHAAAGNHALLESVNHGAPAVAATPRPAAFAGPGVVHARGADTPSGQPQSHQAAQPGGAPRPENHAANPTVNRGQGGAAPGGQHRAPVHAASVPRANVPPHQGPQRQAPVHNAGGAPHPAAHPAPHPQPQQGGHGEDHPHP